MSFWDFFSDPKQLNAIGTGIQAAGGISSVRGTLATGEMAQQAGEFTAEQLRVQEGQAQASSQRTAYFAARDAKYVESAALASAAASGGGASDPTVINTIAQIAAEGAYRQQTALYEGTEKARTLEMQAQASQYEGAVKNQAAKGTAYGQMLGVGANLLKGYAKDSSLFQRFGAGGPGAFTEGNG